MTPASKTLVGAALALAFAPAATWAQAVTSSHAQALMTLEQAMARRKH